MRGHAIRFDSILICRQHLVQSNKPESASACGLSRSCSGAVSSECDAFAPNPLDSAEPIDPGRCVTDSINSRR